MKLIIPALAFLFAFFGNANTKAETILLETGYVRYEVKVKTLGIGGEKISAVNRKVIGRIAINKDGNVEGGLIIPIVGFDSNNTKRDKDVANILKYKDHPAIIFEVADIAKKDIERILSSDSGHVDMKAKLTVAGRTKLYDIVLNFLSEQSHEIRFTTHINARFSDYGIKPPRMGLILKRAPDQVLLYGDLICKVKND